MNVDVALCIMIENLNVLYDTIKPFEASERPWIIN